ncbi:hypothetical protein EDC19_0535 [Natranaerovirga hydrolytica]|uniref:SprT-like family protein n=1 Tax=Natranaerovirga hydrolytica TaxID=680378 RepID=A0A4R1MXW9_9FIRM|nr:hypothetical protein [Natranaerovirga hydrolytica]TCK98117.1 hypothetical protein EDC19_0535 [Natranaerovirga hydrolytica]
MELINLKYDEINIKQSRATIETKWMDQFSNFSETSFADHLTKEDLSLLFYLYDNIFLNDFFKNTYKGSFNFSISNRMTKSAGITLCPKNIKSLHPQQVKFEIRISANFLNNYHHLNKEKYVCGLKTKNPLEALLLIMEHEICHVIEFVYFNQSSCRNNRFKNLAYNIFGHKSSYHALPTNGEIAKEKLGLKIGDSVAFYYKSKKLKGIIYKINKNATVMVKDTKGNYRDYKGNQYSKYYVPLDKL